ncbi:MAG: SDR family NAD(P)-dependent oxidoreductase [Casimicrobiaceae bacterium]
MSDLLAGRVALVTGGGEGIGFAIARAFAGARAEVVIADVNAEVGSAAAKEINGLFVQSDVAVPADAAAAVAATTARYGRLDVLVNNADRFFSAVKASGGWNFDIHPRVAPNPDKVVATKRRTGAFTGTDLEIVLRANAIDTLSPAA